MATDLQWIARKPQVGDLYYPVFQSDVTSETESLTVSEVHHHYSDIEGWEIMASDGTIYDCCWSELLAAWCYGVDDPLLPAVG